MGFINWRGDDKSIDDLVKRAQRLLNEKEASESERKALLMRRGYPPPGPDLDGKEVRCLVASPRQVELYTSPRQDLIPPGAGSGSPFQPSEWIQLPRYCVQYDELWLAQYGWRNSEFQYLSSVEFPKHLQSRYSAANMFTIPSGFRAQREQCAICLTWTPSWATGAVWCEDGCGWRVCYGRTSQDRFFVCRDSCGNRGPLIPAPADKTCLVPGRG
jgi:hypothetical protein